jgi:glycopeptide antibiotics resistance protein
MSFEFSQYFNSSEFTNLHDVLNNFYGQYLSAISANVSPKHGLSPTALASPLLI